MAERRQASPISATGFHSCALYCCVIPIFFFPVSRIFFDIVQVCWWWIISFFSKRFYLFTFRERGRNRSIAFCTCPHQGPNLQPRHVPCPGIETFWFMRWLSNQLSSTGQGFPSFLKDTAVGVSFLVDGFFFSISTLDVVLLTSHLHYFWFKVCCCLCFSLRNVSFLPLASFSVGSLSRVLSNLVKMCLVFFMLFVLEVC